MFENYLSHNLTYLMEALNLSASELSRKTNIRQTTIYKLKDGIICNPTIETLYPIAKYFNLRIEDLVSIKLHNAYYSCVASQSVVPLIHFAEVDEFPNSKVIRNISINFSNTRGKFCIEILDDDSKFERGTLLIIDNNGHYINKDYVVVKRISDNSLSIKRVIHDEDYFLQSINRTLEKNIFNINKYSILGVVIGYLKNYKEE